MAAGMGEMFEIKDYEFQCLIDASDIQTVRYIEVNRPD
jgi:hypothetical protein